MHEDHVIAQILSFDYSLRSEQHGDGGWVSTGADLRYHFSH